jgi:3-deoxy-D-manno-octulosonic-acid transferase
VPLVEEIKALLPQSAIIVSTGTETGQAVARREFLPLGALVCYFPLDLPWAVSQALDVLKPEVFVALESEVWPTFLTTARRRGVSLALMNARLSDLSYYRYVRYKKYVYDIINLFEVIAAGSQEDYWRLTDLGLPTRKLAISGNLKVDALLSRRHQGAPASSPPLPDPGSAAMSGSSQKSESLRKLLCLRNEPVLLAASTHPGEEEVVLTAYEALRVPYPALLLILAPRHPERAAAVGELLARRGLGFQRWQALKSGATVRHQPVVLVDTVGDLFALYAAADVAFVGGSLVPHGGQNILEPAVWGLAPIYGPHLENFRWAEEILQEAGVGMVVQDASSLTTAIQELLENPKERRRLGATALAAVTSHQGAARRQAELIVGLVSEHVGSGLKT